MNQTGTVLLIVMLLMSGCMMLCMTFWRSIVHIHDMSIVRQIYEQQTQILHGMLRYVLRECCTHFDHIHEQEVVVVERAFVQKIIGMQQCNVRVSAQEVMPNTLKITAALFHAQRCCGRHACTLVRSRTSDDQPWSYTIHSWNEHA